MTDREEKTSSLFRKENIMKKKKVFSCVEAVKALRVQCRSDLVIGFYGRYGRRVALRKAGRSMGFKEEVPCRKK